MKNQYFLACLYDSTGTQGTGKFIQKVLGPVVQNIISLTRSLMKLSAVVAKVFSNTCTDIFATKMWVAFAQILGPDCLLIVYYCKSICTHGFDHKVQGP